MESLNSNSQERELQHIQPKERQMHSKSMEMFKSLKSHLGKLHDIYFTFTRHEQQFLIVFRLYFGEEHKTLSLQMFQYLSQLQWKLARHNLHEYHDSQLWQQRFKYYMGCDPETYRRQLLHELDGLGNSMEKKDMVTSCSDSEEQHMQQLQIIDEGAFERAFLEIFGKEFSTVKRIFSQNMDKRQEQLTKEKLYENDSKNALTTLMTPFQRSIRFKHWMSVWLSRKAVGQSKKTAVQRLHSANQLMKDRCRCKKKWSIWVKHWMLVYLSRKVVRQSQKSMIQAANLGMNDTHAEDADIRPVNDEEPMDEVHLTVEYDVLANEQLHTEQSEPIYDTYVLEKVDSNTTPDSTDMSNNGGKTDQDAEQYHVKSPLPASLIKRQTTEQSYQSLKFLALGWHLEEIHVTWAYLEKKRTRLRLYTKYLEEPRIQSVETASRVPSGSVTIYKATASEILRRRQNIADLKKS
ncbi:hypothetical protein Tco_0854994 [Tanacetum coccineum]